MELLAAVPVDQEWRHVVCASIHGTALDLDLLSRAAGAVEAPRSSGAGTAGDWELVTVDAENR